MKGGCQSGYVGHLTYHTQTSAFVDEFQEDIEKLINDMEDNELEMGEILFKNGISLTQIKNIMAWLAFEETVRNLMIECGYEDEF